MRSLTFCLSGLLIVAGYVEVLKSTNAAYEEENDFTLGLKQIQKATQRNCCFAKYNDTLLCCYDPSFPCSMYVTKIFDGEMKESDRKNAFKSMPYLVKWYTGQGLYNQTLNKLVDDVITCMKKSKISELYSEKNPGCVLFGVEECALSYYQQMINLLYQRLGEKPYFVKVDEDEKGIERNEPFALWPLLRLYQFFIKQKLKIFFISDTDNSRKNKIMITELLIENGYEVDDNLILYPGDDTCSHESYHQIVYEEFSKKFTIVASVGCVYSYLEKNPGKYIVWAPSPLEPSIADQEFYKKIQKEIKKSDT